MTHIFIAGLGGFIGTILRYLLNVFVYHLLNYPVFPYGTLIINILGCLVIGFLGGLTDSRQFLTPEIRIFIFIGILGGFTTFSSFGYETIHLLHDDQLFLGLLNIFLHMTLGLAAVYFGLTLSRYF